jgi:putative membrane protein
VRSLLSFFAIHRALVAVLVLPMFLGSLTVWSLADRADRVEQVPAAVVNLDEPVIKKGQAPVAGGRLLAAGLTQPRDEQDRTLGWQLTSRADARRGLEAGDYYAVLTIPKNFSRQLSSVRGNDPERARITVRSNDKSSAVVAQVSDQVAQVAADRLGGEVTTRYLGGLYEQTGELGSKLGDAADGADRLARGTAQLSDGAVQLAEGLTRLRGGADRLADGQTKLARGAQRLAGGQAELARGADRLADGLSTLSRRTDPLPRQTDRLADGAAQLHEGVVGYSKLLRAWSDACQDPIVAARMTRLCLETERAVGVDDRNAEQLAEGSRRLAAGTRTLADGMPALESGIDKAAQGSRELAGGADRLTGGTRELASGADRLIRGARELVGGADEAADGADRLASGGARLDDGSRQLAVGLQRGADAVPSYDEDESRRLADVIATPVSAQKERLGESPDSASQLAPGAIVVALWLGAFVIYLLRPALPGRLLAQPRSAGAIAFSGLQPGLVIGAVQVVLLHGALVLLGVDLGSPVGAFLLMLLTSASFVAINQALVAGLGRRRGWLGSIAFAGVQVVSLGGVIPVDTAPAPLRFLHEVLPMPRASDGLVVAVLDGPGSLGAAVLALLLWGGVASVITVRAARKAQQVDPRDLAEDGAAVSARAPRVARRGAAS